LYKYITIFLHSSISLFFTLSLALIFTLTPSLFISPTYHVSPVVAGVIEAITNSSLSFPLIHPLSLSSLLIVQVLWLLG
jgi:hypothetical protein